MLKDAILEIVNALEWAIENEVPQNFGDYIHKDDLYSKSSMEEARMCAMGAVYARIFKIMPMMAKDRDAIMEIKVKLIFRNKLNESEARRLDNIALDIVKQNDENRLSFKEIISYIRKSYL